MMNTRPNPLLAVDSYKFSHWNQLPPGTTYLNSYIESRGGSFPRSLFFGLQAVIKSWLTVPVTEADVDEAELLITAHGLPFNRQGFMDIVERHGGRWPVEIQAVPEGTVLPIRNVLVQLRNTDPTMPWVVGFLETALLRAIWYPTTVATLSMTAKDLIMKALRESSDDPDGQIGFKLHDFGARGVSSAESAAIGGMAHLVNFMGTDTVEALVAARRFYGANMAGFSIPAMEHSTVTSWGRDGESASYLNMLDTYGKPGGLLACVSDSYDIWNAVGNIWGDELRERVIASGATVVVRPDSGDALTVPIRTIQALGERFGHTVNNRGYKVLPGSVRVIQGDGITIDSIPIILNNLLKQGWSADNLAFGMGGGLLQMVNRDTMQFAMKTNAAMIDGEWRDVYKDPIDSPGKSSKKGVLALLNKQGFGTRSWRTVRADGIPYGEVDQLAPVFRDGELLVEHTFDEIRSRASVREG